MQDHIDYFVDKVPQLVAHLKSEQKASFGLMTPQHMIEHLIWVTKSSIKDYGPAPAELTEGQKKFMHFIQSGKPFQYRPSDKTEADLPELRYASLEEAVSHMPEAIDRLVKDVSSRGDKAYYNPMMGAVSVIDMIGFQRRHFEHHLENQFGLKVSKES
jgi:oxepin-CoA hydrolase/3-oxo-5,6-dehydrosuberyl-CoA semialdehyde dehydrogenase